MPPRSFPFFQFRADAQEPLPPLRQGGVPGPLQARRRPPQPQNRRLQIPAPQRVPLQAHAAPGVRLRIRDAVPDAAADLHNGVQHPLVLHQPLRAHMKILFPQPLPQDLRPAHGLQEQQNPLPAPGGGGEDVRDIVPTHAGDDDRVRLTGGEDGEAAPQAELHAVLQPVQPGGLPGPLQRGRADIGGNGPAAPAGPQQRRRKIAVVRADVGQTLAVLRYQRGDGPQPRLSLQDIRGQHPPSVPPRRRDS